MKTALAALLSADATLMAILTGGLHSTAVEISRQGTPGAFDANGELLPCALLKLSSDAPAGPHHHSARLFFNLYFYQRAGYDQIEAARQRVYTLLHRQKVTPGAGTCWEIRHDNDVLDEEDQALRCAMALSRYVGYIGR